MLAHPPHKTPMIAALYVQTGGVYYGLDNVDPWDETRDARLYAGPYPVVAHPPCNKWSPLAYINRRRLPDYEIGDDGGCFASALEAVRRYGGVLEHPAQSLAWPAHGLPKPKRYFWKRALGDPGWVTEVDQGSYGHRARKRTWLYLVGVPVNLEWTPHTSRAIVSGFLHRTGTDESRRVRPAEASRTPLAFRDELIGLAERANEREAA